MNIAEMTKLFKMASSGEMQSFVAQFQAELSAIQADRLALRQAFPKGYLHFNARMDSIEGKLDTVLALLAEQGKTASPEQSNNQDEYNAIGEYERPERVNGNEHDATARD